MTPRRGTLLGVAMRALTLAAIVVAIGQRHGVDPLQHVFSRFGVHRTATDHPGDAFQWWYGQRAYPGAEIPAGGLAEAWAYSEQVLRLSMRARNSTAAGAWTSLGPDNVAGRMLAVAIDPVDTLRVWAGSAGGGLWLSTTGGIGVDAWDRVETGFPTYAVSAIVIDPTNPSILYIGTGEVGRPEGQIGTPGARTTYGSGVLKSTDGGASWQITGLNWLLSQTQAVVAMKVHPTNPLVLWAATTAGLYKTTDGGTNWVLSKATPNCMDVVMNPLTPDTVFASFGQLGVPTAIDAGIYRSLDGGSSWIEVAGGLPARLGRTALSINSTGNIVIAGPSDYVTGLVFGLYRSLDNGTTWARVSTSSYAGSQAWYDNVVACSPADSARVMVGGINVLRSVLGGGNLGTTSDWTAGYAPSVPPGGPEGTPAYVHADIHAITYNPLDASTIYVACDGGIFKSHDSGASWHGANGGLVTSQFYSGFAEGPASSGIALGGLQDNGTLLSDPSLGASWLKVVGGDGGWCAIDPLNPDIVYEEYVYLNMRKSLDGGFSWIEIHPLSTSEANFIAPFVLCPSSPGTLYAGTLGVKKSVDAGLSWSFPGTELNWNGTPMATMAVSFTSPDTLVAATGSPSVGAVVQVRRSVDGAVTWDVAATNLPTRFPTDVAFDRRDSRNVWLTFSGYGNAHVFKSTDAGLSWSDRSGDLPDIPTQSVVVDPADSNIVYAGTDLGTYRSLDAGAHWEPFDNGMRIAMITDLVIDPVSRRLRAATFGNGVYERLLGPPTTEVRPGSGPRVGGVRLEGAVPNPVRDRTEIRFTLERGGRARLAIHDLLGRRVRTVLEDQLEAGGHSAVWDGRDEQGARVPVGTYFAKLTSGTASSAQRLSVLR